MPQTPRSDDRADVTVVDTTEIRWFAPGPLPAEVRRWFTGSTGMVEERCDTYLLDDRVGVGIKFRGGSVLELKVREELDPRTDLGAGLVGSLEVWRNWTPADGLVEVFDGGHWVDVDKVVFKRRFSLDGTEVDFSPSQDHGPACDVEVAAVTVGAIEAWTLAFAAFGPPSSRHPAVIASWGTTQVGAPSAATVGFDAGRAMGYPEWISRTITPRVGSERRCGAGRR